MAFANKLFHPTGMKFLLLRISNVRIENAMNDRIRKVFLHEQQKCEKKEEFSCQQNFFEQFQEFSFLFANFFYP
jgi:hypothetical protein